MKRIMLLATVAALMSVMLVVGAPSAAFAYTLPTGCLQTNDFWGEVSASNYSGGSFLDVDRNGNDILCVYEGHFGPRVTDDHVHN